MFNVSLWPHIRTRFDWKQLGFRKFVALLPLTGFAVYLWGGRFMWPLAASLLINLILHVYLFKKKIQKLADLSFFNDTILIALMMPVKGSFLLTIWLALCCFLLRTLLREKEYCYPLNIPLILAAMFWAANGFLPQEFLSGRFFWGGTVWRGQVYFISGWLPVMASIIFSLVFLNRLYKWRILAAGVLMPMAYIYLQYRAGGSLQTEFIFSLANYVLFGLGILATDHIASPARYWGQFWYGMVCGILLFLFMLRGLFMAGALLSPLIASLITPLLDKMASVSLNPRKTVNIYK